MALGNARLPHSPSSEPSVATQRRQRTHTSHDPRPRHCNSRRPPPPGAGWRHSLNPQQSRPPPLSAPAESDTNAHNPNPHTTAPSAQTQQHTGPATVHDAGHAVDTLHQGWRTDYAPSYATILCRGVRHGSAKTYTREVAAAIRGLPDDMPLEQAPQRLLQQLALRPRGGSGAQSVVSGVRYCEKVGMLRQTISETH